MPAARRSARRGRAAAAAAAAAKQPEVILNDANPVQSASDSSAEADRKPRITGTSNDMSAGTASTSNAPQKPIMIYVLQSTNQPPCLTTKPPQFQDAQTRFKQMLSLPNAPIKVFAKIGGREVQLVDQAAWDMVEHLSDIRVTATPSGQLVHSAGSLKRVVYVQFKGRCETLTWPHRMP